MGKPVDIAGTDYTAHEIGARDYIAIMQVDDPLERIIWFAYHCTFNNGAQLWKSIDDTQEAPWPLVKKCGEAALVANEMLEADHAGN